MNPPELKPKICKQCKTEYRPKKRLQVVCSLPCSLERSRETQREASQRAQKQRDARARVRLKTRSEWTRDCQGAFNSYIRARDYGKPCISSGRYYGDVKFGGKVDAGHYRSVGSASHLRFNFLNCHAQSVKDNRHLSGNIVEYRKGLIARIGLERVEALENDNEPRKFDIEYLARLTKLLNKRARYYKKRRGI